MQFKTQLSELNNALAKASIVKPKEDPSGISGFLLVARGDTCFIYSEDDESFQKTRVSVPITDLDEEGSMVLPYKTAAPLSMLEGDITLTSKLDDGAHLVSYESSGGAEQTLPTLDPRFLQALDKDLEAAKDACTFSTAVLKDALQQVKPFMPDAADPKVKDVHKGLSISLPEWKENNPQSDGFAFGTTGHKACFYYCDGLKDRGLSLHGLRISLLLSFLSKVKDTVTYKKGATSSYFVSEDGCHVIGWSDSVTPPKKFEYYTLTKDTHVLRLTQSVMLKNLEFMRKSLGPKQDRVRVQYDHEKQMIRLFASDNGTDTASPPIGVVPLTPEDGTEEAPILGGSKSKEEDIACNFSLTNLIEMVGAAKSFDLQLRIAPFRADGFLFRTVESYHLDIEGKVVLPGGSEADEEVFECQVTRFSLSRS